MSTQYPLCTSHRAAFGTRDLRQDGKLWIIHIPWDPGLKSYTQPHLIAMLPGIQEGGCLSEEAYQLMRKKKVQFLLL